MLALGEKVPEFRYKLGSLTYFTVHNGSIHGVVACCGRERHRERQREREVERERKIARGERTNIVKNNLP